MKYIKACPKCHSEDYEHGYYDCDFDYYSAEQWWSDCHCRKCGCKFEIVKEYELKSVVIREVSEN